jgi:hypothetical protein
MHENHRCRIRQDKLRHYDEVYQLSDDEKIRQSEQDIWIALDKRKI